MQSPSQQPTLWESPQVAPRILRVSDLNRRVRALLDSDGTLADVWVEGEISQPSFPPSGHCFFTLKDGASQIRAVMFREELGRAIVRPGHGMQVVIHGRVRAYEPQGIYQLYAYEITPAGAGGLPAHDEALRVKLAAEGLFDAGRKRQLPRWPRRIGVVTSPIGAVWRDIGNVMRRRYPFVELVLSPSLVQGPTAAPAIVRALQRLYAQPELDLGILARGGGSLEDLWPFNDERVVRCVVAAPIPVVVGVGHESDVTLADFAADVRAPTPSAAAELAVPDGSQLLAVLARLRERASTALLGAAARRRRLLAGEERALAAHAPNLEAARQQAAELVDRGHRALAARIRREEATLNGLQDALRALGPHATLQRGYAVARLGNGEIVRDAEQASIGDGLEVVVAHGSLGTRVERVTPDGGEELL
jgi:exodeoxyribonuclease VII large subunit